jgi:metallo-beta-lactamase family protein
MTIQFCGAAREVTGSAHLITLDNGFKILLDCGLYQGGGEAHGESEDTPAKRLADIDMDNFNEKWIFNPREINCLILSHAHIDHSGRIPKLVKDGFKGMIYCTHATRDLAAIMLLDSAAIQEKDAEYENKKALAKGKSAHFEPLYEAVDVKAAMPLFVSYGYERWFSIHKDVEVLFRDAGHILGSASITLRIKEKRKTKMFGFSGDIGRPNRPILNDPLPMPPLDYLICESTYGDKLHIEAPAETERFLQILHETIKRGGKVIIPAFSVGRTQEIVYLMDRMETEGRLPRIPVYVDSPLSVDATEVFMAHPECFDEELNEYMRTDPNPFGFKNLIYVRKAEDSIKLNTSTEPCVIISASGMGNAGRIKHHLANNIQNKLNTILIVGYASPETPAGQLRSGKKTLKLFGETKNVLAQIKIMDSFSAHGDYKEMLQFIDNQRKTLKQMFLVHGDYERQQVFQKTLQANGFAHVAIPALGETVVL